jgi:hypothetical protein
MLTGIKLEKNILCHVNLKGKDDAQALVQLDILSTRLATQKIIIPALQAMKEAGKDVSLEKLVAQKKLTQEGEKILGQTRDTFSDILLQSMISSPAYQQSTAIHIPVKLEGGNLTAEKARHLVLTPFHYIGRFDAYDLTSAEAELQEKYYEAWSAQIALEEVLAQMLLGVGSSFYGVKRPIETFGKEPRQICLPLSDYLTILDGNRVQLEPMGEYFLTPMIRKIAEKIKAATDLIPNIRYGPRINLTVRIDNQNGIHADAQQIILSRNTYATKITFPKKTKGANGEDANGANTPMISPKSAVTLAKKIVEQNMRQSKHPLYRRYFKEDMQDTRQAPRQDTRGAQEKKEHELTEEGANELKKTITNIAKLISSEADRQRDSQYEGRGSLALRIDPLGEAVSVNLTKGIFPKGTYTIRIRVTALKDMMLEEEKKTAITEAVQNAVLHDFAQKTIAKAHSGAYDSLFEEMRGAAVLSAQGRAEIGETLERASQEIIQIAETITLEEGGIMAARYVSDGKTLTPTYCDEAYFYPTNFMCGIHLPETTHLDEKEAERFYKKRLERLLITNILGPMMRFHPDSEVPYDRHPKYNRFFSEKDPDQPDTQNIMPTMELTEKGRQALRGCIDEGIAAMYDSLRQNINHRKGGSFFLTFEIDETDRIKARIDKSIKDNSMHQINLRQWDYLIIENTDDAKFTLPKEDSVKTALREKTSEK